MYRSNTCGELRLSDAGKEVTLAGWVQRSRKMGGMTFVDLRDRYGLTQLVFNEADDAQLCDRANKLGREFCIQVKGVVSERQSKNPKMPTGDIEILVKELNILSESLTPPFTIEDNTDGGDDIRMKYRYLDLRRAAVRKNLELRHRMTIRSPCLIPMIFLCWIQPLRKFVPSLTISFAMVSKWVVDLSVSTMVNCRRRCSRFLVSLPSALWPSLAS